MGSSHRPAPGRARGLRALVGAWGSVLVRPGRFFSSVVVPGDQAPGLTFAMAVVLVEETVRLVLVPEAVPRLAGGRLASAALVIGLATLLVLPLGLHVLAAVQTVLLMPLVAERAGVSETVQVLAYATAPCVLAGPPVPWLRLVCGIYGTWLLVEGLATVHRTTRWRAALAGAIPAAVLFGYGFRGFGALADLVAGTVV